MSPNSSVTSTTTYVPKLVHKEKIHSPPVKKKKKANQHVTDLGCIQNINLLKTCVLMNLYFFFQVFPVNLHKVQYEHLSITGNTQWHTQWLWNNLENKAFNNCRRTGFVSINIQIALQWISVELQHVLM